MTDPKQRLKDKFGDIAEAAEDCRQQKLAHIRQKRNPRFFTLFTSAVTFAAVVAGIIWLCRVYLRYMEQKGG